MDHNRRGFTIVELLIVIVVIAILAAISIVAYNGIQSRGETAKTISAVSTWVKALQLYKAENGSYPTMHSCMGSTSTYAGSHSGRCWGLNTDTNWFVQPTFITAMSPYLSNQPEPSQINVGSDSSQRRGAMYYRYAAGAERVYVIVVGSSPCPEIGGLGSSYGNVSYANGKECYYYLPQ